MKTAYYTFAIETPFFIGGSIVVLAENAAQARQDAYTALRTVCGSIGRIKTASADAKRSRKLPNSAEPIKRCASWEDGEPVHWAWLVLPVRKGV